MPGSRSPIGKLCGEIDKGPCLRLPRWGRNPGAGNGDALHGASVRTLPVPRGRWVDMTRARMPRPHEVAAARRDVRLLRALAERDAGEAWRTRGVCSGGDPETFFPAPNEPADAAVALCRGCDVRGPCLAWALEVGDCHGVWGGTTPRERRAMLVAWREQGRPDGEAGDDDPEEEVRRFFPHR